LANETLAEIGSSIVALNTSNGKAATDLSGDFTSLGSNLFGSLKSAALRGELAGNIAGRDPRLGSLQENGGGTWTHALLWDSPALDAGRNFSGDFDQRGFPRVIRAAASNSSDGTDIGAFEFIPLQDGQNVVPFHSAGASLSSRREADGSVRVTLSGGAGHAWIVQASSDLQSWEAVGQINPGSDPQEVLDAGASTMPFRFYRATVY
jgi:hypothetical protein